MVQNISRGGPVATCLIPCSPNSSECCWPAWLPSTNNVALRLNKLGTPGTDHHICYRQVNFVCKKVCTSYRYNLFYFSNLHFVHELHRLVRAKKYMEQDQIQQMAMIPDKEAKHLTYKLLQENYLQMQELRKPTVGTGLNKTFFLFHVNLPQVTTNRFPLAFLSFILFTLNKLDN